MNNKILGARVPDKHYDYFEKLAKRRAERKSDVLRLAVLEFYESRKAIEKSYREKSTDN